MPTWCDRGPVPARSELKAQVLAARQAAEVRYTLRDEGKGHTQAYSEMTRGANESEPFSRNCSDASFRTYRDIHLTKMGNSVTVQVLA